MVSFKSAHILRRISEMLTFFLCCFLHGIIITHLGLNFYELF